MMPRHDKDKHLTSRLNRGPIESLKKLTEYDPPITTGTANGPPMGKRGAHSPKSVGRPDQKDILLPTSTT